jgi:hypothetical protein
LLEERQQAAKVVEAHMADDEGVEGHTVDLQDLQVIQHGRRCKAEVEEQVSRLPAALGCQV